MVVILSCIAETTAHKRLSPGHVMFEVQTELCAFGMHRVKR